MTRCPSRRTCITMLRASSAAAILLSVASTPAWAYVDPGTGAMLLQMMAAVFAGAVFYFRSTWRRIAGWLTGRKHERAPSAPADGDQQDR